MVEMVAPELGDTVYDPASGTAGFLIDVVDHVLARYSEAPEEVPILRRGLARAARPDPGGGYGGDPEPPDLPEGSRREDPRLAPARSLDPRHRRVAPDDAPSR